MPGRRRRRRRDVDEVGRRQCDIAAAEVVEILERGQRIAKVGQRGTQGAERRELRLSLGFLRIEPCALRLPFGRHELGHDTLYVETRADPRASDATHTLSVRLPALPAPPPIAPVGGARCVPLQANTLIEPRSASRLLDSASNSSGGIWRMISSVSALTTVMTVRPVASST